MKGPPEGPRYINGLRIIFEDRSAFDMKDWVCKRPTGCGMTNKAIRLLIFDVAPMSCGGCKAPNPNSFIICLANARINGVPIIGKIKMEVGEDNCVPTAISQLAEMMNNVAVGLSSDRPDLEKSTSTLDPMVLVEQDKRMFPPGIRRKGGGIHKMMHMLQRLIRGVGVPMKYFKTAQEEWVEHYFRGSEIRMIHCDDFEEVSRQIADGNAILSPLTVGSDYAKLKYCQFYTAVPAVQIVKRKEKNIPVPGHMILLVGAMSEENQEHRSYLGLEAGGEVFCRQVGGTEGWLSVLQQHVTGEFSVVGSSVFKITADSDFMANFYKVSRLDDEALPPKNYGFDENSASDDVTNDLIDTKCEAEEEGSTEMTRYNDYLIYHGRYFTDRLEALGRV